MVESGVTGIAYETVELVNGVLPLLTPMSEVAGRMSVQFGAYYLERHEGGRGKLLGGIPGVPLANVVIIGGGVVGTNAAQMALGLGASVTLLDINIDPLRYLSEVLHSNFTTWASNPHNITTAVQFADLLICGVLVKGAKAPKLVIQDLVSQMKPGSLSYTKLQGADLNNVDFREASLIAAKLQDTYLNDSCLQNVGLQRAEFCHHTSWS